MTEIEIPNGMDRFCFDHYALIRDYVLFNEQTKQRMLERFNNDRDINDKPVMMFSTYQEQKTQKPFYYRIDDNKEEKRDTLSIVKSTL